MSLTDIATSSPVPATRAVPRPLGLTVLAVVLAWFAIQMPQAVLSSHGGGSWAELLIARAIALASAVSAAFACVGVWKIRPWALQAFAVWAVVLVTGGLLGSMVTDPGASIGKRLAGAGIAAAVLLPVGLYVRRRTDQVRAAQYVKRTPYQAGRLEVITGIVLLVPSVYILRWLTTSPDAGYLMILGLMLALGALLASIVAVTLIIGGIWTAYELPGRHWAHALPLAAGIGAAGYFLNQL